MNDARALDIEDDAVVIRTPLELKRRRGRKEVIVPRGGGRPPGAPAQEALLRALARAFRWQELIESGRYLSLTELAEALGFDRSYVGRILSLAHLAPDIVEAIARGKEPSGLSLEKLRRIPLEWAEQRRRFGFEV